MEERKLQVSFNKSGSGSITNRVTLPITWLREMGITEEDRDVKVLFKNNKIIIEKDKKPRFTVKEEHELIGKKWCEVSDEIKERFDKNAFQYDYLTHKESNEKAEIVHLTEHLAIKGHLDENLALIIADDSKIFASTEIHIDDLSITDEDMHFIELFEKYNFDREFIKDKYFDVSGLIFVDEIDLLMVEDMIDTLFENVDDKDFQKEMLSLEYDEYSDEYIVKYDDLVIHENLKIEKIK